MHHGNFTECNRPDNSLAILLVIIGASFHCFISSYNSSQRPFAISASLSTGKYSKLSLRFCGPWKIIKKLSEVAYRLELPLDCRVHPMLHVSKLQKYISREDNLIEDIVSLQESKSMDRSPYTILDRRQKRSRNHVIQVYLVAWRGLPLTDSTWESKSLVHKYFTSLIIEDTDL
ncbi:hypothetical protein KP509_05G013200 [Ceratopteris richardii]|uniref:Chromo domain-containing protein n=1 Tax=Ceratopteris richardii TaxID=49495 RepID=A0A8T2URB9_CERRI|nr:hypothetical protein KP509_05G013200 [Ceratopteris richardii]